MSFRLEPLPFSESALEPYISARTVELHYRMHHAGYLEKLEKAVRGTQWENSSLTAIVVKAREPDVFRNAAQAWNHSFYWKSMQPPGQRGGSPDEHLRAAITRSFGSEEKFRREFRSAATGHFASGWAWLLARDDGGVEIACTSDADNPIRAGRFPLLTIDVWEHAYYLDYQNERARYVSAFVDELINWRFAARNLLRFRQDSAERASA